MFYLYRSLRRPLTLFFGFLAPDTNCRFVPTCSVYCQQALKKHGLLKGTLKCVYRLLRCQPLSKGGIDPR